MKKLFYFVPLITMAIFTSCEKGNFKKNYNNKRTISVIDGTLHFADFNHLVQTAGDLFEMKKTEKENFEKSWGGFRSLGSIFSEIEQTEIMRVDSFHKGLNPELKISEYEALGYFYKPSLIYQQYLKKGIIIETVESDGSKSFKCSVENPGFLNVINENGEVFVGEEKYVFHSKFIDVYNNKGEIIKTLDFNRNTKATSNWSNGVDWIYDGDSKRYSYEVYGNCITSSVTTSGGIIESTFYVAAHAENKRFGTWAARSSYLPIYSYYGNWNYTYQAKSCYSCSNVTNPFALNDNDVIPPLTWSSTTDPNGQTNNFTRFLRPNGTWTLPNGWYVTSPLSVNYYMVFSFSGGVSGYTYTLTN